MLQKNNNKRKKRQQLQLKNPLYIYKWLDDDGFQVCIPAQAAQVVIEVP